MIDPRVNWIVEVLIACAYVLSPVFCFCLGVVYGRRTTYRRDR